MTAIAPGIISSHKIRRKVREQTSPLFICLLSPSERGIFTLKDTTNPHIPCRFLFVLLL
jgi:hypothetical protein